MSSWMIRYSKKKKKAAKEVRALLLLQHEKKISLMMPSIPLMLHCSISFVGSGARGAVSILDPPLGFSPALLGSQVALGHGVQPPAL